ncbi:MAG: AAA family ATPase [Myxococcota bacterium]
MTKDLDSISGVAEALKQVNYVADEDLATSVFLSLRMRRPLFLEGAPGVGKTEMARMLTRLLDTELIRLQCFEGLDVSQAAYEWNYSSQLLALQSDERRLENVFTEPFLLKRPLLSAIDSSRTRAPVLLIDELDRADEEFESFLLELLGDFQITIPELGTLRAHHRPVVVLTSNRTREIHDALKRRCIYHWIDYPSLQKELEIVSRRVPGIEAHLCRQVVGFVQALRREDLMKVPGIAETVDWAEGLGHLGVAELEPHAVDRTLGLLLKVQDDLQRIRGERAQALLNGWEAA